MRLIYLTFIHCMCKFLSENYEQTFPNKKNKLSFPSENYNQTFHNKIIKNLSHMKSHS
jgi:hypothetical protein